MKMGTIFSLMILWMLPTYGMDDLYIAVFVIEMSGHTLLSHLSEESNSPEVSSHSFFPLLEQHKEVIVDACYDQAAQQLVGMLAVNTTDPSEQDLVEVADKLKELSSQELTKDLSFNKCKKLFNAIDAPHILATMSNEIQQQPRNKNNIRAKAYRKLCKSLEQSMKGQHLNSTIFGSECDPEEALANFICFNVVKKATEDEPN